MNKCCCYAFVCFLRIIIQLFADRVYSVVLPWVYPNLSRSVKESLGKMEPKIQYRNLWVYIFFWLSIGTFGHIHGIFKASFFVLQLMLPHRPDLVRGLASRPRKKQSAGRMRCTWPCKACHGMLQRLTSQPLEPP